MRNNYSDGKIEKGSFTGGANPKLPDGTWGPDAFSSNQQYHFGIGTDLLRNLRVNGV